MNLYYYQLLLLITKYSCKHSPNLGAGGEERALKYLRANVSSPCVGDLEMEAQPQNIFCVCTTLKMLVCRCCGRNHALHSQERSNNIFYSFKAMSLKNPVVNTMMVQQDLIARYTFAA